MKKMRTIAHKIVKIRIHIERTRNSIWHTTNLVVRVGNKELVVRVVVGDHLYCLKQLLDPSKLQFPYSISLLYLPEKIIRK